MDAKLSIEKAADSTCSLIPDPDPMSHQVSHGRAAIRHLEPQKHLHGMISCVSASPRLSHDSGNEKLRRIEKKTLEIKFKCSTRLYWVTFPHDEQRATQVSRTPYNQLYNILL